MAETQQVMPIPARKANQKSIARIGEGKCRENVKRDA
jgi:hypothetical protein